MEKLDSIPVVWIVGESVLIEGVATSLEGQKVLTLIRWEKVTTKFIQQALFRHPAVIIFEIDSLGSYRLMDLLSTCPGIQLVGIDRDCGQVMILSSYRRQSITMQHLTDIVIDVAGKAGNLQKGGDQLDKETITSGVKNL